MSDNGGGQLDQASPEELDHMRSMVATVRYVQGGPRVDEMTDAEVLDEIDQNWPGGAAQFAREVREEPGRTYGCAP
jgi:hypothetical protein